MGCSVVDYALLLYNSWTYSDKPILKHPFYVFIIRSRGASHPFKSKVRAYLPALCLEFYHLFRWENALILKPWNGFFTSFFFVQSSYDGENSFFYILFLLFPLILIFSFLFFYCWFLQVS